MVWSLVMIARKARGSALVQVVVDATVDRWRTLAQGIRTMDRQSTRQSGRCLSIQISNICRRRICILLGEQLVLLIVCLRIASVPPPWIDGRCGLGESYRAVDGNSGLVDVGIYVSTEPSVIAAIVGILLVSRDLAECWARDVLGRDERSVREARLHARLLGESD